MTTAGARWLKDGTLVMPQTLLLQPTEKERRLGICNSPTKCMYALGLRRVFPDATYVSVNPNSVAITLGQQYHHYAMPKKGVAMIARYDNAGKNIESIDLNKAAITLTLKDSKPCKYVSTGATRKYHAANSRRRRADPNYVRPDSKKTLRAQLSRSYLVRKNPDQTALPL